MTSTVVALACDWEGDWYDELGSLVWLILSPGMNLTGVLNVVLPNS